MTEELLIFVSRLFITSSISLIRFTNLTTSYLCVAADKAY